MSLRLWSLLGLFILLAGTLYLTLDLPKSLPHATWPKLLPAAESPAQILETLTQEISTPGPLKGSLASAGGPLTPAGILAETNKHRRHENLATLSANPTLDQAAKNKLNDMFAGQYFEHVSPSGVGVSDVVNNVGYKYLRVGENLALGNYASDSDLVQAWMDSPGHRKNILGPGFSELGVAAARGSFQGQDTWLAVQTFALPASACPTPNPALQNNFDAQKKSLASDQGNLASLKQQFDDLAEQGQSKIQQGNEEIKTGNRIAQEEGNEAAQKHWDAGAALQEEGQQLIEQAQAKQTEYNNLVSSLNQKNDNLRILVDQINRQVKTYNACLSKFQ